MACISISVNVLHCKAQCIGVEIIVYVGAKIGQRTQFASKKKQTLASSLGPPQYIHHMFLFHLWVNTQVRFLSYMILHYDDVIMTMLASQITSLTVVYSIVYSGVNQRKHQSSASLAFVREIHRGPVNFPHKWPVTRKMFPFDDVIMCKKILMKNWCYEQLCSLWIASVTSEYMHHLYIHLLHSIIYEVSSRFCVDIINFPCHIWLQTVWPLTHV